MTAPSVSLRHELLDLLACPDDGTSLNGWDGITEQGFLTCGGCGRAYPVIDGLPRLLPQAMEEAPPSIGGGGGHEFAQKRQEMAARDAQVAMYDSNLPLRLFSLPEIPLTLHYLWLEPDVLMLEGGCGTGRMTAAFAARVRGLICIDFSAASLQAARAKLSPELAAKVLFVQADLCHLPLLSDAFDRVGSFQVLEHLPTADARERAVAELTRVLQARARGGRLALSAYRWGPPLSWGAQKEGHHEGGIPFFRSTWTELSRLVAPHIAVEQHTCALLYHYLLWGRKV